MIMHNLSHGLPCCCTASFAAAKSCTIKERLKENRNEKGGIEDTITGGDGNAESRKMERQNNFP